MKLVFICSILFFLNSCANKPKCGNPEGARSVLTGSSSCQVRIRQVTIGSDFNIPESLKGKLTSDFTLDWQETRLIDGRIELGHFVLIQESSTSKAAQ